MRNNKKRVVLIAGATSGIGHAMTKAKLLFYTTPATRGSHAEGGGQDVGVNAGEVVKIS